MMALVSTNSSHLGHPHYAHTGQFCERYDGPAFDPKAETLPLELFEPMLRRVMHSARYAFTSDSGRPWRIAEADNLAWRVASGPPRSRPCSG